MHAFGMTRTQLITQSEVQLNDTQAMQLRGLLERRLAGEPVAYIVGEREFFGLAFHVTPDVLIPRPDTELLVELAIRFAPKNGQVLDLGTGSGAIAVSLAHQRPDLTVTASDISAAALSIAQKNATRHLAPNTINFIQSDWYTQIPHKTFDLIVSNPPYIVKGDHHLSEGDLRFEPINALTDHADGLSAYRHILHGASQRLAQGGWILLEHGYDQAESLHSLLTAQHFHHIENWKDLAGIPRVTGGQMK